MKSLLKANLEQLRIFDTLARTGSMTKTAQFLFKTQPAISHSVHELQKWLGIPLIVRKGRRIELTDEGKVVHRACDEMFRALSVGQHNLEEMRDLSEETITIGVTQLTLKYFLLPYLQRFHDDYPNLMIRFETENMKELLDFVLEGRCDVAVIAIAGQDTNIFPKNIVCVPLSFYHYQFIASRRYFANLRHKRLSFQELSKLPIISMKPQTLTRECFDTAFAKANAAFKPVYVCDMMAMVTDLVKAGFGIGTVFSPVLDSESAESSDLFEIPLKTPFPEARLVLIYDTRLAESPVVTTLVNALYGYIEDDKRTESCVK